MRPDSVEKVAELAPHIGAVYAGMNPDFRILAQQGRKRAQEVKCSTPNSYVLVFVFFCLFALLTDLYFAFLSRCFFFSAALSLQYFLRYKDEIPTKELVKRMASIMQEYTQSGGVRPFGVSLLMGGWDDDGPHLFQVDPSGSYWAWKASALGKNMKNAKTFLEKRYSPDIELEDAIHTAILTLKEGFDGEMTAENVDIAVIGDDRKYKVLSEDAIRDYLTEVES